MFAHQPDVTVRAAAYLWSCYLDAGRLSPLWPLAKYALTSYLTVLYRFSCPLPIFQAAPCPNVAPGLLASVEAWVEWSLAWYTSKPGTQANQSSSLDLSSTNHHLLEYPCPLITNYTKTASWITQISFSFIVAVKWFVLLWFLINSHQKRMPTCGSLWMLVLLWAGIYLPRIFPLFWQNAW